MLSDEKLLELVYDSALCCVPTDQLDDEQLENLDNIKSVRWCKCRRCQGPLKMEGQIIIPETMGHVNKKTREIGISRPRMKQLVNRGIPISLLELIATVLHEIVHIVYPEYDEDKTVAKTWEWLKRN